ncbi:MAG: hypothetical protein SFU99_21170 [Saprospiraceae bacterium]|nr:hypothetical protein [Saprospiraceae bacterium]
MGTTGKLSTLEYVELFKQFSKSEQLSIAEKINALTFDQQWELLDAELPNVEISEEEVMEEIRAVRYGKKTEN